MYKMELTGVVESRCTVYFVVARRDGGRCCSVLYRGVGVDGKFERGSRVRDHVEMV